LLGGVDYQSSQISLPLWVIGDIPSEMQARIGMDMVPIDLIQEPICISKGVLGRSPGGKGAATDAGGGGTVEAAGSGGTYN